MTEEGLTPEIIVLEALTRPFDPYFEDFIMDPGLWFETAMAELRDAGELEMAAGAMDDLLSRATDEESARRALSRWVGGSGLPDGPTHHSFLAAMRERIHDAVRDPDSILTADWGERWTWGDQRASAFTDEESANRVLEAVVEHYQAAGGSWSTETTDGWALQHIYADLTELRAATGEFGWTAPLVEIDRTIVPDPERTRPATSAVAILEKDAAGEISVTDLYPEIALDQGVRAEYPDLCHWFGGYFGKGNHTPSILMKIACRSTADPARSRVRAQLGRLLAADDESMRRIVEACGSYVVPQELRAWVDRTLWRLDAFPWLTAHDD